MVTDVVYPFLDSLEAAKTVEVLSPFLQSTFRASIQPYLISWFQYDPRVEIAKLECPVLIIQGTTDIQVGVEDAESLAKANQDATLQLWEGMNHILKEAEMDRMKNIQTYSMPDLPLKEGLVDKLVRFFKN